MCIYCVDRYKMCVRNVKWCAVRHKDYGQVRGSEFKFVREREAGVTRRSSRRGAGCVATAQPAHCMQIWLTAAFVHQHLRVTLAHQHRAVLDL